MTPNELEAYDAMIADRDRWKERAERLERLYPSGAAPCSAGPVTLRNVLIVMAADMLMTGEMPPEDASDWSFSKSTTLRDKVRVIGHARRAREQCRKWGVRLSEIAKSLPNDKSVGPPTLDSNEATE